MEDLEIEPGICATRIRCYTEGAMQRPSAVVRNQTAVRETLYRSASSLLVSKLAAPGPSPPPPPPPSSSSAARRELCRSCDQLPPPREAASLARTFVSSVNIALAKPPVARKLSLPAPPPPPTRVRPGTGRPAPRASTSTGSLPGGSSRSGEDGPVQPGGDLDGGQLGRLPWDIDDDFPHVPVLDRIKEFEKQTGGLRCRSSSPGKWKRKGKTQRNKSSSAGGHSSSDRVTVRNSRNSSPMILRLHTELPNAPQLTEGIAKGKASDGAAPTIVPPSDGRASAIQPAGTSPVAVVSCQQDSSAELVDETTDSRLGESRPAGPSSDIGPADSGCSSDVQDVATPSAAAASTGTRCPDDEGSLASRRSIPPGGPDLPETNSADLTSLRRSPSEQTCRGSLKERTEDVVVETTTARSGPGDIHVAGADTTTTETRPESASAGSLDRRELIDQESRDHRERAPPAEDCTPTASSECMRNEIAESLVGQETREATADVAKVASEELSGRLACIASADCKAVVTDVVRSTVDSSSEGGARSAAMARCPSEECNSRDAGVIVECATAPDGRCEADHRSRDPEEPAPSRPWIDEIFQAGQGMDTDVYSQRCSQQLGENGSPLAAVMQQASVGEEEPAPALLAGSASPCLSDCYSRSNSSSSSSDDESPSADGPSLTGLLQKSSVDCSSGLSPESTAWNTRTGAPPLAVPEEFPGPLASTEASSCEVNQGDSEQSTDDSSASTSDSEALESLSCIREVLASDRLPDLSSSLGACGGAPSDVAALAPDGVAAANVASASAFSRHLSALIAGQRRRRQQQRASGADDAGDSPLNADQALFLSRVNLILAWIHNQQSQPGPHGGQPAPPASEETGSLPGPPSDACPSAGEDAPMAEQSEPAACYRAESREERTQLLKRPRRRRKKFFDPDKVSHLRYLILQSPLVLSDGAASGSDDESDVELNEFGEVKQDYPLGRLPDYIVAQIFGNLPTRDLAALKCACKDFKWLIERFDIGGIDSRWSESPLYREDPCMQCGKIRDPRGDVSLCRWHPKIYYKNGEIGRHYWTCCFAGEEEAPGCETSLHDNKWSGSHSPLCKVPRSWRQYWRSYPMDS